MEALWLNALNLTFGLSRIRRLLKVFGSAEKSWGASLGKLTELGFNKDDLEKIIKKKETLDPQKEWLKLEKENIVTVSFNEKDYPKLLKEISSPPILLYLKGDKNLLPLPSLAVVGTRTPSSYGRASVETLIEPLVKAGLTIVSGLAQGIDALAHIATLKAGGQAIAVLGSGLDQIYPRINLALAGAILKNGGLLVSEYPVGMPALKQNFPARNRIICGLSLGTFVVESKEDGGALITAQQALESNREVFALPGPINQPTSQGTNRLVRDGAKVVLSAQDILQELNINLATKAPLAINLESLEGEEKVIAKIIQKEPTHIDKIIQESKLKPQIVTAALTRLELKGLIKNTGGQNYIISS